MDWNDYSEEKSEEIEKCCYDKLTYLGEKDYGASGRTCPQYGLMVKLDDGRDVLAIIDCSLSNLVYFIGLYDIDEMCVSVTGYRSIIPYAKGDGSDLHELPDWIKEQVKLLAEELPLKKQAKLRKHKS